MFAPRPDALPPAHDPRDPRADERQRRPVHPGVRRTRTSSTASTRFEIAKAARKRQPDIQLFATLYTPPPWMKTNNAASGGGEARATLKNGLELELAEYVWAFLRTCRRTACRSST